MNELIDTISDPRSSPRDTGAVSALVGDAITSLDALIAAAPEEPMPPVAPPFRDSVSMKGWDPRYTTPIDPEGDQWIETFKAASRAVEAKGLVAFLGDRGTGKTRMAAEIARAGAWPKDDGFWDGHRTVFRQTALYTRAMDVFLDLRDANKKGSEISEKDVLARLAEVGLLVIDEFQERGETDWENRVITNLLDKRYASERPTILIANLDRAGLSAALSPSVKDRMHENGKSFTFGWQSYRRAAKP